MNVNNKAKADEVLQICKTGELRIGSIKLNIKEDIEQTESIVYRRSDIDKLNISEATETEKCVYQVVALGADVVPFAYPKEKVCILNFASSKNPGGGYRSGAMAQEEALCYASNLGPALEKHMDFYEYNRTELHKGLYSDGIIYSKDVVFFKNKGVNTKPVKANVITCAAPNWGAARKNGVKESENHEVMVRRIKQIFDVAIANDDKTLVLGAFGCGVFANDPEEVANIMYDMLEHKKYKKYFNRIVFAMNGSKDINAVTFKNIFGSTK
jgi:uncharacterized protein (TIGR02452 family)